MLLKNVRLSPSITRPGLKWSKLEDGTLKAEPTEDPAHADEIVRIKGHVYASRAVGDRALVRQSRGTYGCGAQGHTEPDAIKPGDVYVETLYNGSRNTGGRVCMAHAVAAGDAWVDPEIETWDGDAWVPVR